MTNIDNTKTIIGRSTMTQVRFSISQVTSADGTIIGYRQIGKGPALIIMHGGLRASQHYERLASALADTFTVYIPDRRGRGLSGPAGDNYSVTKECEDLAAILQKTKARMVFGHSGGALFALPGFQNLNGPLQRRIMLRPWSFSSKGCR